MRAKLNPHVQLTGTGSEVGSRWVSNDELERIVQNYDPARSGPFAPWVDQVTHIHERPFAEPGARTCDLAFPAAQRALEMAGIQATDLSLIVYASFTSGYMIPGDHCELAVRLGASRVPTFVLTAACAGSIYGLAMAYGMIASRAARHVLVIGSETITQMTNWHDPLTAILFGDGAGAAVLSWADDAPEGTGMLPPYLGFEYSPTAITLGNANTPHGLRVLPPSPDKPSHPFVERALIEMNGGPNVLRSAVVAMSECTVRVLGYELSDLRAKHPDLRRTLDAAWLVPHQANGRILDGLSDRLAMPRTIRTIYRYGNMSAASNLVALDHGIRRGNLERVLDAEDRVVEVRETGEKIRRGDLVLLPSIGGGYLMGCAGLRLHKVGD